MKDMAPGSCRATNARERFQALADSVTYMASCEFYNAFHAVVTLAPVVQRCMQTRRRVPYFLSLVLLTRFLSPRPPEDDRIVLLYVPP